MQRLRGRAFQADIISVCVHVWAEPSEAGDTVEGAQQGEGYPKERYFD